MLLTANKIVEWGCAKHTERIVIIVIINIHAIVSNSNPSVVEVNNKYRYVAAVADYPMQSVMAFPMYKST